MPKKVQDQKCLMQPTQAMLKRISKLQKPILKNDEEYQRVQMQGTSQLLKEMMMATIKAANDLGALNTGVTVWNEDKKEYLVTNEFIRAMEDQTMEAAGDIAQYVMAGMQSSAVNYAGLVLTGKMDPIYDHSLDTKEARKHTRESAEAIIREAGFGLAQQGALEETEDGRMVLREQYRLFDTIKGSNYGKSTIKRKTKGCLKGSEQPINGKSTGAVTK